MLSASHFSGKTLEFLVRTALTHRELSPGIAAAVEGYRKNTQLTATEKRLLEILDSAILDGCIVPIKSPDSERMQALAAGNLVKPLVG